MPTQFPTFSANYIDTILSRLNNKISCIWISGLIFIDRMPDKQTAKNAFKKLLTEYPRLCAHWDGKCYEHFHYRASTQSIPECLQEQIDFQIDPSRQVPLRLGFIDFTEQNKVLFFIQLHHAVGDGRTFTFLIQRYFELLMPTDEQKMLLTDAPSSNSIFLKQMKRFPSTIYQSFLPSYRLGAKRALPLKSNKKNLQRPLLRYALFSLENSKATNTLCSQLFYASMIRAAAELSNGDGPIRLRIPVDIRSEIGLPRAFGNLCPCFSLEMDRELILKLPFSQLVSEVNSLLKRLFFQRAHHATHLEGMLFARFFNQLSNKLHDFHDDKRTNTLVVTYMGEMDKILRHGPFTIDHIAAHTPTWGSIGLKLKDRLVINLNCFEGIWSDSEFEEFFAVLERHLLTYQISRLPQA